MTDDLFALARRYGIVIESQARTNEPPAYLFYKDNEPIGTHTGGHDIAVQWLRSYIEAKDSAAHREWKHLVLRLPNINHQAAELRPIVFVNQHRLLTDRVFRY